MVAADELVGVDVLWSQARSGRDLEGLILLGSVMAVSDVSFWTST